MKPEFVIAVDPGPEESAYVVWDGQKIHKFGKVPNAELLAYLSGMSHSGYPLAMEMIASYGLAVGETVFETCVWIGRFMQAYGAEYVTRITRIEVKSHVCHSVKAKDGNIRQAIIDRLGAPGTKSAKGVTYGISKDVWAALAVALTFWDKHVEDSTLAA